MRRRDAVLGMAAFAAAMPVAVRAGTVLPSALPAASVPAAAATPWQALESSVGGRLGVAVLDTADGRLRGHRLDERFPLCSTFKWLAAAAVLHRVDGGQERLDRRIRYGREALLPHAPVTETHVDSAEGLTLAALCEATVATSDNPAANLILAHSIGGPAGFTRFVRTLGDDVTRLDRLEPELNDVAPGDPRDTTTPRAMAQSLRTALLGEALTPASRALLARWMEATVTSGKRLKADLPAGWRVGGKTGTGPRGSAHDVGIFWPPGERAPLLVAVYLTGGAAPLAEREAVIAAVARSVTAGG